MLRYASADLHSDLLGGSSLFLVQNPAWRVIRSRMTPFFSAAKLKQMFQLMKNVGNELTDTLTVNQVKGTAKVFHADIKDLFSRYSTDVIASCAFGIEANSLKNPESEFLRNGKRVTVRNENTKKKFNFQVNGSLNGTAGERLRFYALFSFLNLYQSSNVR